MPYIIKESFNGRTLCVSAPPGYAARKDGTIYRDGTDPLKSGPEWHSSISHKFKSHRAAARVKSKCSPKAMIIEVV